MCLQQFAAVFQIFQALGQFLFDGGYGLFHAFGSCHVVGRGEDTHLVYFLDDIASDGVNVVEGIDIIAKEFNAHCALLISRNDIDCVALGAECTAGKSHIVAFVLDIHQQTEEAVTIQLLVHGNND